MTIFFLCFVLLFRLFSPGTYSIEYHFPEHVEKRMSKWIESCNSNETGRIFFCLFHSSRKADEIQVICCQGLGEDSAGILAQRSRRYVTIKGTEFPILFDFDEKYSLSPDQGVLDIGQYGYRNGTVKRRRYLFHGPSLFFKARLASYSTPKNVRIMNNDVDSETTRETTFPIVYVFSDEMEKCLCEEYERASVSGKHCLQIAVDEEGKTVFRWMSPPRSNSQTNRFAIVDKTLIPLYFDFDDMFANLY